MNVCQSCGGSINGMDEYCPACLSLVSSEYQQPILLNPIQRKIVKDWAEDDRLWTTRETTAFNLEIFARAILRARPSPRKVAAELLELRLKASQTIEENEQAFLNRLRLAGWSQQEAEEEWRKIQNDTESEP